MLSNLRFACLALLLSVLIHQLFAGETGKIAGHIVDKKTGEALPGANIQIVGTTLGAAADVNGEYFIINIPPGTYDLKATIIGYKTVLKKQVPVSVDKTTWVDLELTSRVIAGEKVVVTAYKPDKVEIDLTATRQSYNVNQVKNLPGISQVDDILSLQADADGGHFRGGRTGEALYLVGGAEIINPLTGSSAYNPIAAGLDLVEVYTSGFSAEYGNVQSGVINMVPKEAGEKWRSKIEFSSTNAYEKSWGGNAYSSDLMDFYDILYDLEEWVDGKDPLSGDLLFGFSADAWNSTYAPQEAFGWPLPPPPGRQDTMRTAALPRIMWLQLVRQVDYDYAKPDYRFEVSSGGPISKKIKLFFAAQLNSMQPFLPLPNRDRNKQLMSNLTYQLNQNNKIRLMYNYADEFENQIPGSFLRWFEPVISVSKETGFSHQFGISWNHVFNASSFMDLNINHLTITDRTRIEILDPDEYYQGYQGNSNWQFSKSPSGHTGSRFPTSRGKTTTNTLRFKGSLTNQINNRNLLKTGLQFFYYDMDIDQESGTSYYPTSSYVRYRAFPYEGAIYVQNKMEYEGFIANIGLRYDFYNFNTDYYTNTFSPYRNPNYDPSDPANSSYYDKEDAAKEKTKLTSVLQPRLGFSFPVSDKTVLHLNYGIFMQRPAYNYILSSTRLVDSNPDFRTMGNASMKPERTIAYDLGIVVMLPLNIALDLSAYYKNVSNLTQYAEYVDRDGFVYGTYDNRDYADVKGFHITLDKKYGFLNGSIRYNWESATGQASSPFGAADQVVHYEGEPEKDKLRSLEDIYLDFNRKHKLVANLVLRTSASTGFNILQMNPLANLMLSGSYRYLSGRPFTWDPTGQGLRFNQRTPEEHHLRIRLEKKFGFNNNRITAFIEGYNLLNKRVWSYHRTFSEDPENQYRNRYKDPSQDVLTETDFSPYVTSLEPYLLANNPRYYRFGIYYEF